MDLVDHIFTTKEIAAIIYCFKNVEDYISTIQYLLEHVDEIPANLFSTNGKVRRKLLNELNALLEKR